MRLTKPLLLLLAGLPLALPAGAWAQGKAPANPTARSTSRLPPATGGETFPGFANPGEQTVNPNLGFLPPNPWAPVSEKNPLPLLPGKSVSESAAIQARERQDRSVPDVSPSEAPNTSTPPTP